MDLDAEFAEIDRLTRAVKAESMIYQASAKRSAAAFNGVDAETYFLLPYAAWREVYTDAYLRGWPGF